MEKICYWRIKFNNSRSKGDFRVLRFEVPIQKEKGEDQELEVTNT